MPDWLLCHLHDADVIQVVDEEDADQPLKPSPDADTHLLFVRPTSTGITDRISVVF